MKALAFVALVACGAPKQSPTPTLAPTPTAVSPSVAPPVDAGVSQDEVLAAIQKAMNDLSVPAHGCWAAAATDRFDVEGELQLHVDIAGGTPTVAVAKDSTNSKRLGTCMVALLQGYQWAPPLANQSFELPFKFSAPQGQSVIDRQLVESHAQGKIAVSVLLDEYNTGAAGASMFEVAIDDGGSTGTRKAERAELWYFLDAAKLDKRDVAAGDMMFVPKDAAREVTAAGHAVHAAVIVVPGGREGAARAGALPTREITDRKALAGPKLLPASAAKTYGPATIFLDESILKSTPLAASILQLPAGANVAEHVHGKETELLYVLAGAGTMTVAGTPVPVTATSVVEIPPNTPHSFVATEAVRAVQVYTPAGPEQRFKKPPAKQ